MMRRYWSSLPILYKLYIPLILGVGAIVSVLLVYLWGHESDMILNKERDLLQLRSMKVAERLDNGIENLRKELRFLSRLEIMEDMTVDDLDRRISFILQQKGGDLGQSIDLAAVDLNGNIVAASKDTLIHTRFIRFDLIAQNRFAGKNYFYADNKLYLFEPITGTFSTDRLMGYLVMVYPIINFDSFLVEQDGIKLWLLPPSTFHPESGKTVRLEQPKRYLHDSVSLSGVLDGWTLHYAILKKEALEIFFNMQQLFFIAFGLGLFFIFLLIWVVLRRIVEPLHALSKVANNVALTGDYTQKVIERGNDEIGTVGRAFNTLMSTTKLSMERIELLAKTEASLREKSSFLSSMSHELRTPLGSILSLTQYLMTRFDTSEPALEVLGKIENSAHHLLSVINNVLDLAKIEAGKMEPRLSQCDPVGLVASAIEIVMPLADDKGLKMQVRLPEYGQNIVTDPRLLSQVLINLLSNAVKFTDKGHVSVMLRKRAGGYVCEITDTGCGIDAAALGILFDEFYQVPDKNVSRNEGSGLGLAISKRIAFLLQGDLRLYSDGPGKGTKAILTFDSYRHSEQIL